MAEGKTKRSTQILDDAWAGMAVGRVYCTPAVRGVTLWGNGECCAGRKTAATRSPLDF